VAEITNSKTAAASIRQSIQYFNAKNDYNKHLGVPPENRTDYVPTKEEVYDYKDRLQAEADQFKEMRVHNEDILPEDDMVASEVAHVKDYILDLNDKFDFLVQLFLKGKKLNTEDGKFGLTAGAGGDIT